MSHCNESMAGGGPKKRKRAEQAAEKAEAAAERAEQAAAEAAATKSVMESAAAMMTAAASTVQAASELSSPPPYSPAGSITRMGSEGYFGDESQQQEQGSQVTITESEYLSDEDIPADTPQPSLVRTREAAEEMADNQAGQMQATSTTAHLQQPGMSVDDALTSAAEEEIEIPEVVDEADESELSEVETVIQATSNADSVNWKKKMKDALEEQAVKAQKEGKYYEFKGFFGRGTLILAREHQGETESQLLRRHVSTLPTSTSAQQQAAASAADAEEAGAMSENEAEIDSTPEADIELLINYFTLLSRFPDNHPLPSAADLKNASGHFIFIPTQSGLQLIDLDKYLPVGNGGIQDSATLQQARILGAVLSSIEHKKMFIIKKDNSISKEITEAFSTAIGESFHATLSNTPNTQRLFLKLLNYYLWYQCPKEMAQGHMAVVYDQKLKELYEIINEIFNTLEPIKSAKLLILFIKELSISTGRDALKAVVSCKPLAKLDSVSKIILDKLHTVDADIATYFKNRLNQISDDIANTVFPPAEEGKEEIADPYDEKTGEPGDEKTGDNNLAGGASKRGKKRTKKRKSKMLKRKSKKHLKKAKKGMKTGKKVRFNLPSKKSKKKKTRKKR